MGTFDWCANPAHPTHMCNTCSNCCTTCWYWNIPPGPYFVQVGAGSLQALLALDVGCILPFPFPGLFLFPYFVLFLLGLHTAIRFDSMWED